MHEAGVDFLIDVHGDEDIPHLFIANSDGIPSMTPEIKRKREVFESALQTANPDYEPGHGYPEDPPGEADLSIGSKWVGENFKCVSLTLEQPFRDNKNNEKGFQGWSPERSKRLGATLITAINAVLNV